jgi:peptide deformylase
MELKIITYPNPILLKKSSILKKEDILRYNEFADNMIETMLKNNGIGFAAPQAGENICLIVINKEATDNKEHLKLFNPKITYASKSTSVLEEGCLSLPEYYREMERPDKIRIKACNEKGEKIQLKAKGLFSHVLQHEIDHLTGKLINI